MKKQSTFWVVIVLLVVVAAGAAVYFGNAETQKGSLTGSLGFDPNNKAFWLVDSARSDTDFDNVLERNDQCPNQPPYGILRFIPGSYAHYLGQVITLKEVDNGGTMTFDVSGKKYAVTVGNSTYIAPLANQYPGFGIRGLFYSTASQEAIVVVQRTDYNVATGCSNR